LVASNLQALTEWSAGLRSADIPQDVLRRAALILLDDFGALVAAREEPELIELRRQIGAASGPAEATVFDGGAHRLDRYSAALSNGSGAAWCELDGGFRPAVCHAGLYTISAVLAEAEAIGAAFDEMLLAVLVGYETVARVARTFVFPPFRIHPHAGLATIGAAAAVSKLRGHDAALMATTINSAATLVLPGPFKHAVDGALIRNVWPGLCAQNGLRAADWAAFGICGTPNSLSDVLSSVFGARIEAAELCAGLGENWAVFDGYYKLHACCQYGHSTVEAICGALGKAPPPDPSEVRGIRVETHENARNLNNPDPATTLAAKFSIQHIAAASLTFGHAGASAFHQRELTNPELVALRRKVEIAAFEPVMPPPNDRPARVTITLRDGRRLRSECLSAQGGRDRPFAEEQIIEKFRANVEAAYPESSEHLLPLVQQPHAVRTTWRTLVAQITGG
jgi:2-methylcitrate dehydratase PrpD